ncbi:hypothetical protein, partial [Gulosibacter sediminis]|uniref:hypothetical protein n=1 Tax=Gulosibacter sediminis TaxID=1729695 RepID=UPI0018661D9F
MGVVRAVHQCRVGFVGLDAEVGDDRPEVQAEQVVVTRDVAALFDLEFGAGDRVAVGAGECGEFLELAKACESFAVEVVVAVSTDVVVDAVGFGFGGGAVGLVPVRVPGGFEGFTVALAAEVALVVVAAIVGGRGGVGCGHRASP